MMLTIGADDLRKALAEIEAAEANGFMHCRAVFDPDELHGVEIRLRYSDMCERAHPYDPSLNWGRFQGVTRRHRFENGRLVELGKAVAAVDPQATK